MATRLPGRSDKLLARTDRDFGKAATYHSMGSTVTNPVTGEVTTSRVSSDVKVRSGGSDARDLSELKSAGFDQVDAVWKMRFAYQSEVKSGDILTVGAFNYEVIDQGAFLDALGLDWTIFTRRRR